MMTANKAGGIDMRGSFCVVILATLIVGCTKTQQIYAPDGRVAYALSCGGAALSWNSCLERAGEICKAAGYDVIDRREAPRFVANLTPTGGMAGTTSDRSMVIACRNTAAVPSPAGTGQQNRVLSGRTDG